VGVKAVLFDFGGVIIDSPFDAFSAYEARRGLPPGFLRKLNSTNPNHNAWARLERSEVDFEEFCHLYEAEAEAAGAIIDARELFANLVGRPRPAMVEAVRRCHRHFKTGLLTNNFLTPLGGTGFEDLSHLFDVVVESARAGIRKPDPRFYELALAQLQVAPDEAVFLDDLGINLKPARAMGMTTIRVGDPIDAISQLEEVLGIPLLQMESG